MVKVLRKYLRVLRKSLGSCGEDDVIQVEMECFLLQRPEGEPINGSGSFILYPSSRV
jgi:hypothetical protein